ncbi:MAG: putative 2-dehydropantoate 2-reductase [Thermodesulfobacteriota bacterium]|nr:putative 2-dehydropantoate 2-reductase [Thermodesulfobacteriota bacterium]
MKVAVIGTGAVGGYYGGLICRSGVETHFLMHSDYDHVKEHGLVVDSKGGDFTLPSVNACARPEDMPKCDVALVALKTTANRVLADILPHVVRDDGIVVLLQNGIGVEDRIHGMVPGATIIGGLCFLCSNKVGPGHIRHLDFGAVRLAQYKEDNTAAGITPPLEAVGKLFEQAGISVMLAEDLVVARWQKLVWNMAYNGTCVVLAATTDQLMADASAVSLVRGIMEEVAEGARVCGHPLEDGFIDVMLEATKKMVAYSPSMKLDFEAGRPLEVEEIYRTPIAMAHAAGYHMVRAAAVADQLEFLDRRNRADEK